MINIVPFMSTMVQMKEKKKKKEEKKTEKEKKKKREEIYKPMKAWVEIDLNMHHIIMVHHLLSKPQALFMLFIIR